MNAGYQLASSLPPSCRLEQYITGSTEILLACLERIDYLKATPQPIAGSFEKHIQMDRSKNIYNSWRFLTRLANSMELVRAMYVATPILDAEPHLENDVFVIEKTSLGTYFSCLTVQGVFYTVRA